MEAQDASPGGGLEEARDSISINIVSVHTEPKHEVVKETAPAEVSESDEV